MPKLPLKSVTLSSVNDILQTWSEGVTRNVEGHEIIELTPGGKCHIYLKILHGLEDRKGAEEKQI